MTGGKLLMPTGCLEGTGEERGVAKRCCLCQEIDCKEQSLNTSCKQFESL